MAKKLLEKKEELIEIHPIRTRKFVISIEGTSPLLCHRRSPEIIRPNPGHEHNDQEDFNNSLYPMIEGKHTFPSVGLKKCAVAAAGTFLRSIKKNSAKGSFFIPVEYLYLDTADGPLLRQDVVIIQGKAIVRTRAQFDSWKMDIPIEFSLVGNLTAEQLVNLFNVAGNCVGIGDWRPEKAGIFGRFKVTAVKELK